MMHYKTFKDIVGIMLFCKKKYNSLQLHYNKIRGFKTPFKKNVTTTGKYYSAHISAYLLQNVLQGTASLTKRAL